MQPINDIKSITCNKCKHLYPIEHINSDYRKYTTWLCKELKQSLTKDNLKCLSLCQGKLYVSVADEAKEIMFGKDKETK
jgi:hypothetical protein